MEPITLSAALKSLLQSAGLFGLDALFGGSDAMTKTPMTPEERELNDASNQVDMALDLAQKAATGNYDYAGQGEGVEATIFDAVDTVLALPDSGLEFFGDTKEGLVDKLTSLSPSYNQGKTFDPTYDGAVNSRGLTSLQYGYGLPPANQSVINKVGSVVGDGINKVGSICRSIFSSSRTN